MTDTFFPQSQDVHESDTAAATSPPQDFQTQSDAFLAAIKRQSNASSMQMAQAVTAQNADQNADQAAKAAPIGRQLGLPQSAVETDVQGFQQQALQQKNSSVLMESPSLSKWVGDNPDAARIAQNEYDKLSLVEKLWGGVKNDAYAALQAMGAATNKLSSAVNMTAGAVPLAIDKLAGTNTADWWYKTFVAPAEEAKENPAMQLAPNASFGEKASYMVGGLASMLSQIVLSGAAGEVPTALEVAQGAKSIPTFLGESAAHGAKSMALPALTDMVNTANDVYKRTGDMNQAIHAAEMQYATTTLGGIMPISTPGGLAGRLASGFVSGVTTGEVSRNAMNLVLPDQMQEPASLENTLMSGLSGMMLGGFMGPHAANGAMDAVRKTYLDTMRAEQAQQDNAKIQTLGQVAEESKLREADPNAFHDYIKSVTDDKPLNTVYVDAKTLENALHQSGVDPEEVQRKMPDLARQLDDAKMTGGDVSIPVADYATYFAGKEIDKTILPELKSDPDGMTKRESDEFYQNAVQTMQERANQVAGMASEDEAMQADIQGVHDNIKGQFDATGRFPSDVSDAYASMIREFYATQAERLNMKPSEVMAQHPLNINAENPIYGALKQGKRGAFTPDANTISLLKGADLSTFIHESGHFFLETMGRMAQQEDASPKLKEDFDTALKFMGEKDAESWGDKTLEERRAGHEKFAEAFEKYMMEGKSPNLKMQSIFSRFRSWMLNVYKSMKGLNVKLNPEIRGVFDRLLATDASIHEAETARAYMPLFKTAQEAGMSDKDFADYQQLGKDATDTALNEMQAKSVQDMQWASNAKSKALKDLQRQHDRARKEIAAQVIKEVAQEPANQARLMLTKGKMFDADGKELPDTRGLGSEPLKLDKKALDEMYSKGALGNPDLKKLRGMIAEGGLHPDVVADMFGIDDGHELIRQLTEGPTSKERIAEETDRRMLMQYGEFTDPESVERAANEAVHNEARARFMATGLKALTKSPLGAKDIAQAAKEAADNAIAQKRIADLTRDSDRKYLSAETKANKDAVAKAAKQPQEAIEAQRTALLNNRMAKAAADAIAEVQKGVDYLNKFNKESVRDKIDVEYRDQIDDLLSRFDLRRSTPANSTARKEALRDFVERQAALGLQTDIPQKLLDEMNRQSYKNMTVEDFRGLVDSVRMIEGLGKLKDKLIEARRVKDLDAAAKEAVESMWHLDQHDFESNRGLGMLEKKWMQSKAFGRSMYTSLLKMEQMFDWLDRRNPLGPMNRFVFRPIADAGVRKNEMLKTMKKGFDDLAASTLEDITKDGGKIYVSDRLADSKTGGWLKLTKKEMLDMAGHMGNESSMKKMLKGEKWKESDVWAFLHQNMRKGDWDYVAGMAKAMESLWPEKLAQNKRLGITDPEKIEPRPFETDFGKYDGWYWPMKYDPARSKHVSDRADKTGEAIFESLYTRQALDTDTGRMNTRVKNYAAPILLNIDHIPRIIADEIHDLAYREPIISANDFLSHPDVRKGIVSAMSPQHYDQIRPWLVSIANDGRTDNSNMRSIRWMNDLSRTARLRATMVGLGFRISTTLVHGASAGMESIAELGPKWFANGLADFMNPTQWSANKDFVFERSGEMANRMNEVDRDIREHLHQIDIELMNPALSAVKKGALWMQAHSYHALAMLDMASALPVWKGAYNKALTPADRGGLGMNESDAIYFADKTVRNAHGGTGIKDLAAVQRGPEMAKLFTMFYTFWNHNANRLMDTARLAGELPATYRSGDMQQFRGDLSTVILRTLIYTFGVQAMHGLFHPPKQSDGEEGWAKWAAKALIGAASGGVPVMRDIATYMLGEKDYAVNPVEGIAKAINDSRMDAMHEQLGQQVSSKWLKHSINTAGYVFGLPTGQAASSVQFLYDLEQGKQNPQDAGDWMRGIMMGDMHKH